MKTLYLLRHAKSSWGDPGLPDHDRPLNERGRKAATAMGRYLRKQHIRPGLILASTAQRVNETLALLMPELGGTVPVVRDRSLYLATPDQLLSRLRQTSGSADSVLIVGHNPGIQEIALRLAGDVADDEARDARDHMKEAFPTAALATIRFAEAKSWHDVGYGKGELSAFVTPRRLKG